MYKLLHFTESVSQLSHVSFNEPNIKSYATTTIVVTMMKKFSATLSRSRLSTGQ